MPAKIKITKEMITEAAFEIARSAGADNINARTVAEKLNCSTQPILYQFATVKDLKKAVYGIADNYHSEYLMKIPENCDGVMLGIGMNYIRFAVDEPHLFRFLFESDSFGGRTLSELIDAEELSPVLDAMRGKTGGSIEQVKEIFLSVFLFVHGYASLIAHNSMKFEEETVKKQLAVTYLGIISAVLG